MDDCLLWAYLQSKINILLNCFKEGGPSYNQEHSKVESVSLLLVIEINSFGDGGFQFYQTVLIHKVMETTQMDSCNGFTTLTKVD